MKPWPRFHIHKAVKVFLIAAVSLLAMGSFIIGREIYAFRGYNEAEAVQPLVWKLAERMRGLHDRDYLPLASADEWLAELSVEESQLLRHCQLRWTPDLDPKFALKVNDRFGFQINAKGEPGWLGEGKLAALFSQ